MYGFPQPFLFESQKKNAKQIKEEEKKEANLKISTFNIDFKVAKFG
jgi:hypothetical protein